MQPASSSKCKYSNARKQVGGEHSLDATGSCDAWARKRFRYMWGFLRNLDSEVIGIQTHTFSQQYIYKQKMTRTKSVRVPIIYSSSVICRLFSVI